MAYYLYAVDRVGNGLANAFVYSIRARRFSLILRLTIRAQDPSLVSEPW